MDLEMGMILPQNETVVQHDTFRKTATAQKRNEGPFRLSTEAKQEELKTAARRLGVHRNNGLETSQPSQTANKIIHAENIFVAKKIENEEEKKQGVQTADAQVRREITNNNQYPEITSTAGGEVDTEESKKSEPELTPEQKAVKKMLEQNETMQKVLEQYAKLGDERISRMMQRLALLIKENEDPEETKEMSLWVALLQLIISMFQGSSDAVMAAGEEAVAA